MGKVISIINMKGEVGKTTLCVGISDYLASLIKSEYNVSCNYVHGGKKLEHSLISVLDEYINNKLELKNSMALYNNMSRIITTFIRIIISNNTDTVNACFHRKKTILRYLIGN